ncbi:hypothetical protein ABKV19_018675 [Rosa sericea]
MGVGIRVLCDGRLRFRRLMTRHETSRARLHCPSHRARPCEHEEGEASSGLTEGGCEPDAVEGGPGCGGKL